VAEASRLTQGLLDQLAAQWRKHDAPIARQLAPGLSDTEIDALTAPLGLTVPAEARTWWGWHNGAHNASVLTSGGKAFPSLDRCVSLAARMRDMAYDVTRPHRLSATAADEMAREVWNWDWLPLCEDGVGTMLVIDAAADSPARDVCAVWYRAHDQSSDQAVVVAPSIGALVREWTRVLETSTGSVIPETDQWALEFETLPVDFDRRLL
jgi:cell wall assembly regulator SMI1